MRPNSAKKAIARRNNKRAPNPNGKVVVRNTRLPSGGDKEAAAYARLLVNPCTAPLVHPVGYGGSGGFLTRAETDFIVGNGATQTAGFLRWAPGALCTGGTDSGLAYGVADTDAIATTAINFTSWCPGYSYLTANSRALRCVAACAQVFWPGSELNRSGLVSGTVVPVEAIPVGGSFTVANIRAGSGYSQRMPTESMEIKWSPSTTDALYENAGAAIASTNGHNSIVLSWAGLPVSTGVRIRLVAVYEWLPNMTNGFVASAETSSNESTMSITALLTRLRDVLGEWRYPSTNSTAMQAAQLASQAFTSVVAYARYRQMRQALAV
jgi:hypothetical protein